MAKLIIKNVPSKVGTYSLKDLCQRYGAIEGVQRQNGEVHVKMQDARDAKKAYQAIKGMPLLGNELEALLL